MEFSIFSLETGYGSLVGTSALNLVQKPSRETEFYNIRLRSQRLVTLAGLKISLQGVVMGDLRPMAPRAITGLPSPPGAPHPVRRVWR